MEGKSKYFDPGSVKVAVKNGSIWTQMLPWAYASVLILLGVLFVGLFWPVIQKNIELREKKILMQTKLDEARSLSTRLQQQNHLLQNDPAYIEQMARDILNVGRRGETIFRFPEFKKESTDTNALSK